MTSTTPTGARLIERLGDLPPMPDVCLRINDALLDPKCSPKMLAGLIERDPALSASVLKLANSAYFSVAGGVGNVLRAVQMLGFSAIHQMVLCAISAKLLSQAGAPPPPWNTAHSQAVAATANWLATQLRLPDKDVALAAGLLHDIGRTVVAVLEPALLEKYQAAVRGGASHSLTLELEVYGADHQVIGRAIAERWKYPPRLIQAIAHHHTEPIGAPAPSVSDVVALADSWAWAQGAFGCGGLCLPVEASRAQRLGVSLEPTPEQRTAIAGLVHVAA